MKWGIDVLAADPVPAHRQWVPIQKNKYRRHEFGEREDAEIAKDAMLRSNRSLELRVVPIEEKT